MRIEQHLEDIAVVGSLISQVVSILIQLTAVRAGENGAGVDVVVEGGI